MPFHDFENGVLLMPRSRAIHRYDRPSATAWMTFAASLSDFGRFLGCRPSFSCVPVRLRVRILPGCGSARSAFRGRAKRS